MSKLYVTPQVADAAASTRKPSDVMLGRLMAAIDDAVRKVGRSHEMGESAFQFDYEKVRGFDRIAHAKQAYDAARLREGDDLEWNI